MDSSNNKAQQQPEQQKEEEEDATATTITTKKQPKLLSKRAETIIRVFGTLTCSPRQVQQTRNTVKAALEETAV
jgi:hypothetical protein